MSDPHGGRSILARVRGRLTYANVMSTIAVFGVLAGGGAWAAATIDSGDIKANAVRSEHIKKKQVKTADLADGAVTARKLAGSGVRAFARVDALTCSGTPPDEVCPFDHAKGVTSVARVFTGTYCITVPGISPASVPAVATVDYDDTPNAGNASAEIHGDGANCDGAFEVETERVGSPNSALADNVEFAIVIP